MVSPQKRVIITLIVMIMLGLLFASQASGQYCPPGSSNCRLTPNQSSQPTWPAGRVVDMSKYPPGSYYDPQANKIYVPKGSMQTTVPQATRPAQRSPLTAPPAAIARTGVATTSKAALPGPVTKTPTTTVKTACRCLEYNKAIYAKLVKLEANIAALKEAGKTQEQLADAFNELVLANQATLAKLDAALALLAKSGEPANVILTVHSVANLPASYVDTSAIWALQRKTGLSHGVMVVNSDDPEWSRLEVSYKEALSKFPAMQLIDVKSGDLSISPTPQLVLYYKDGREPEVISGDRLVAGKLRELYTQ